MASAHQSAPVFFAFRQGCRHRRATRTGLFPHRRQPRLPVSAHKFAGVFDDVIWRRSRVLWETSFRLCGSRRPPGRFRLFWRRPSLGSSTDSRHWPIGSTPASGWNVQADNLGGPILENSLRRRVEIQDDTVLISDKDRIDAVIHQGTKTSPSFCTFPLEFFGYAHVGTGFSLLWIPHSNNVRVGQYLFNINTGNRGGGAVSRF